MYLRIPCQPSSPYLYKQAGAQPRTASAESLPKSAARLARGTCAGTCLAVSRPSVLLPRALEHLRLNNLCPLSSFSFPFPCHMPHPLGALFVSPIHCLSFLLAIFTSASYFLLPSPSPPFPSPPSQSIAIPLIRQLSTRRRGSPFGSRPSAARASTPSVEIRLFFHD